MLEYRHLGAGNTGSVFCFFAVVEVCAVIAAFVATSDPRAFGHHLLGFTLLFQIIAIVHLGCWCCLRRWRRATGVRGAANAGKINAGVFTEPGLSSGLTGLLAGLVVGAGVLVVCGRYLPGAAGALSVVTQLLICLAASTLALYVVRLRQRYVETREYLLAQRLRHHFLFNTLNTTVYLIGHDSDTAVRILTDLSELFRTMLRQTPMITLAEEAEFTRRYIHIERVRLGNRLSVEWRVPDTKHMHVLVPAMVMQPLVENAIYHGVETRERGGTVRVDIDARHNRVFFEIRNPVGDAALEYHARGNRMAQKSVRERLFHTYGTACYFICEQRHGEYRVTFSIPE